MSDADKIAEEVTNIRIQTLERFIDEAREALINFREGFCVYSGTPPSSLTQIIDDISVRYQMETESFINFHLTLLNSQRLKIQNLEDENRRLRRELSGKL